MRGLNVFPRMNTSFDLERPISVHALERAMENGEEIFLVTQREIGVEQPEEKDLYEIGTVARVTQILRVSDRVLRVMMEGACRARLKRLWQREPFCRHRSSSSTSRPPRAIASGRGDAAPDLCQRDGICRARAEIAGRCLRRHFIDERSRLSGRFYRPAAQPALSGQTGYPRRAAPVAEIAAHERDSAPRDRSYRHGAGH